MGNRNFFEIFRTNAIWFGISWADLDGDFEFNINIPFVTLSFLFPRAEGQ